MSLRDLLTYSGCCFLVGLFLVLMIALLFVPESVIPPVQVTRLIVAAEILALLGVIYLFKRNET